MRLRTLVFHVAGARALRLLDHRVGDRSGWRRFRIGWEATFLRHGQKRHAATVGGPYDPTHAAAKAADHAVSLQAMVRPRAPAPSSGWRHRSVLDSRGSLAERREHAPNGTRR